MSKVRVQIITRRATDLARDHIVNTVFFDDFNIDPTGGTNWQAFADDVKEQWRLREGLPTGYGVETKVYNMADALPRPVKAQSAWAQGRSTAAGTVPREVALCLSYFSERNIKRFRGRLYVGPFPFAEERPNGPQVDGVKALATAMANIGGIDVDWGLWSPTRGAFSKITAGWVDNEWDTIRSRGLKPTTRSTYTTNE